MNVTYWLKRIGRYLGYTLFFFLMMAVFLVLTFPTEKTADFLSAKGGDLLGVRGPEHHDALRRGRVRKREREAGTLGALWRAARGLRRLAPTCCQNCWSVTRWIRSPPTLSPRSAGASGVSEGLECRLSKSVNLDRCPRPTAWSVRGERSRRGVVTCLALPPASMISCRLLLCKTT